MRKRVETTFTYIISFSNVVPALFILNYLIWTQFTTGERNATRFTTTYGTTATIEVIIGVPVFGTFNPTTLPLLLDPIN